MCVRAYERAAATARSVGSGFAGVRCCALCCNQMSKKDAIMPGPEAVMNNGSLNG
jgi:hypothetical protein